MVSFWDYLFRFTANMDGTDNGSIYCFRTVTFTPIGNYDIKNNETSAHTHTHSQLMDVTKSVSLFTFVMPFRDTHTHRHSLNCH